MMEFLPLHRLLLPLNLDSMRQSLTDPLTIPLILIKPTKNQGFRINIAKSKVVTVNNSIL